MTPLAAKIHQLETAIATLEEELEKNNAALVAAATTGCGETIAKLAKRNAEINTETEKLYAELVKATDDYERAAAVFEAELRKLTAG